MVNSGDGVRATETPYFAFYPSDWLSDPNVQQLSLQEEGAYIRLLSLMWTNGDRCTLLDDDKLLARMLKVSTETWTEMRAIMIDGPMPVFQKTNDGRLTNKRLRQEYENAVNRSKTAKENGSKGGRPPQNKPPKNLQETHGLATGKQEETHSQAIQNQNTDTEKDLKPLVPADAETTKKSVKFEPQHLALAERLRDRILENKPDARVPKNLNQWADAARLMCEQDKRDPERIARLIDWCQADSFERANVMSMDKLRKRFDELELKANRKPRSRDGPRLGQRPKAVDWEQDEELW